MRILVTGGAGFIGSHVTDVMLAAGHEVIVVDNLSSGKRANLNPQVSAFYELDILDADGLQQVFAAHRPHAVSHQAALANVRESLHEPARYAEVNLLGSINLLEAARRHDCQRIIYASTGGACYGEPLFVPVTEDHPINPLDPYGASKHAVEHYLYLYQHNYGLAYTILRYPNVYGPRQDPLGEAGVIAIFTGAMLAGLGFRRLVLVNGALVPELSDLAGLEAGLSIRSERIEDFRCKFGEILCRDLPEGIPAPSITIDSEIDFSYLNFLVTKCNRF